MYYSHSQVANICRSKELELSVKRVSPDDEEIDYISIRSYSIRLVEVKHFRVLVVGQGLLSSIP